jgi:hypothetical protein
MNNFKFITANEAYGNLYYQLPKVLFTSEYYKDMSNDSKIAYAMLQDRCEYSIQNNWIDEEGHVYFVFTRNELMEILGCKENKVAKIKKELKEKHLLYEKRVPPVRLPGGTFKNYPNRLYLGKLEVTAQDVYSINKAINSNDSFESGKNQLSEKTSNSNDSFESGKNQRPQKHSNDKGSFESGKNHPNLYLNTSLDTNRHNNIDTEKDQLQDQLLLDNFVTIMQNNSIGTFVPERSLNLIKIFSDNFAEAQKTVKTIHNAKRTAEKETGITIVFEEIDYLGINAEQGLYDTILKAYQKNKTEKVENMQNLLFVYVKNWFVEYPIYAKQVINTEVPVISNYDWVNEKDN